MYSTGSSKASFAGTLLNLSILSHICTIPSLHNYHLYTFSLTHIYICHHNSIQEGYPDSCFSYFSTKTYVVGTHWKHLNETLPMSTTTNVFIQKCEKYCNFWSTSLANLTLGHICTQHFLKTSDFIASCPFFLNPIVHRMPLCNQFPLT